MDDETASFCFYANFLLTAIQEIHTALFRVLPQDSAIAAACTLQVRSFIDCALQCARHSAQSFDYDDATRMCSLFVETSGQYDVDHVVPRTQE